MSPPNTKTKVAMDLNNDVRSHPPGAPHNNHVLQSTEPTADDSQWKPSSQVIMILITLSCISFIIAVGFLQSRHHLALWPGERTDLAGLQVDAMILVPALPVSRRFCTRSSPSTDQSSDPRTSVERNSQRDLLGRLLISAGTCSVCPIHRSYIRHIRTPRTALLVGAHVHNRYDSLLPCEQHHSAPCRPDHSRHRWWRHASHVLHHCL